MPGAPESTTRIGEDGCWCNDEKTVEALEPTQHIGHVFVVVDHVRKNDCAPSASPALLTPAHAPARDGQMHPDEVYRIEDLEMA